jgi:hypothetical protein
VRLDPKEGHAEVHEDRGVEDAVGVQIQVLDSIVPEETLEEIAGRERKPTPRTARTLESRLRPSPLDMDLQQRPSTCRPLSPG